MPKFLRIKRVCRIKRAAVGLLACALAGCVGGSSAPPSDPAGVEHERRTEAGQGTGARREPLAAGTRFESLLPDPSLTGFRRVALDPLADKAVWRVEQGRLLVDGVGAKEMLLTERSFGDGVLRVEWRFIRAESSGPAPVYNGGVYVRTPLDGKSWVQLQVAHLDSPPVVGDLIAQVPGRSQRLDVLQSGASPEKPVGEWNTYEVTAQGRRIQLSVNGEPTISWDDCPWPSGHIGLQAEGARIEVRRLDFAPL